jgi:hypothetical protein
LTAIRDSAEGGHDEIGHDQEARYDDGRRAGGGEQGPMLAEAAVENQIAADASADSRAADEERQGQDHGAFVRG